MELTDMQIDALTEIINIGVGKAAGVLNEMVESPINLNVPYIKILSREDMKTEVKRFGIENLSAVKMNFKGSLDGTSALVFPTKSASDLVSMLVGEEIESDDLDTVRSGTLAEIGNIVLNGVVGSIGNLLQRQLDYSVPNYVEASMDRLVFSSQSDANFALLLANTRFNIEKLNISGDIFLVFELASFDILMGAIDELMG
ncbi:MAG: chemotaxis protein CheC [Prolixibacteraceae bacterium]|jgi:chemotaxis protein CheC|nr:chemotaxis protein CheC [Prolixibacteraceae bacterium]MBT6005170.1 chemotaxis protein CheC [Prolixibacteraceae bacterium]MBT6764367.1 chemotaxis protein CheC [Prolixibacteraceae bacterium]MBT7000630.1 chemotaxis protein CheC [Prolixibacteraceae bacterium]MBT7396201.1 chemotaxis protein CheC [Prolixibacteraceae bacterium]